jgi:lysozyme
MPNNLVIDISHHNAGSLDFSAAKNGGVVGVIAKATQGSGFKDPAYGSRKTAAVKAGLMWGAYHFGTAADVDSQLSNFLGSTGIDNSMLYALDFEKNGQGDANTMSLAQAKDFIRKLDNRLGRKAVIYGGNLLKTELGGAQDAFLGQHRLWWAQYNNTAHIPPTWSKFWLWQFTDGHNGPTPHSVSGIGNCDIDTFAGPAQQLQAQWAQ